MAYFSNEPYNKQTSNEGFWQSAGMGMGVGAATAAGIAGMTHGVSYGMMRRAKNQMDRSQEHIAGQMQNAFRGITASPDSKEYAVQAKAIQDGTAAQMRAAETKFASSRSNKFHGKMFGGWKRAVGTYAGSALIGAIAGGAIDYYKD